MIDLKNCRANAFESRSPEQRLETLERIALDLMMEIEALRATVIELSTQVSLIPAGDDVLDDGPAGVPGQHAPYGKAYLETAWRSHCSAGASSGWDKILEQFYGNGWGEIAAGAKCWRELLILRRLGYSEAQLMQYVDSAQAAETYS